MKEYDYDMISRYINGEMTADESASFEALMKEDTELRDEVRLYRDIQDSLKTELHPSSGEQDLRNTLEGMNEEYFSAQKPKAKIVTFRRTRWISAIAAVLVMGVLLTVWSPWKKNDLYDQYAETQMPGVSERGSKSDSLLKKAAEEFNNKKFTEAIPLFEQVLTEDKENAMVHYYHAIALLQDGKTESSRNELTTLYNGTSLFRYDAAFYIALSYLKEKNKTACKDWLEKIPADAGSYGKARELLKKL